jgi:hypothetical protein
MLKRVVVLVGVIAAAAYVAKRIKSANDGRALWHEATTTSTDLR